jgi:hypothetical protein
MASIPPLSVKHRLCGWKTQSHARRPAPSAVRLPRPPMSSSALRDRTVLCGLLTVAAYALRADDGPGEVVAWHAIHRSIRKYRSRISKVVSARFLSRDAERYVPTSSEVCCGGVYSECSTKDPAKNCATHTHTCWVCHLELFEMDNDSPGVEFGDGPSEPSLTNAHGGRPVGFLRLCSNLKSRSRSSR